MAKNNLLKEAIADAKAVRETALANAKIALEEAFTPRIQSMLSAKLAEEEEMDMEEEMEAPEMEAEVEAPVEDEAPVAEEGRGMNDNDEDPTDIHSEEMEEEPVAEEGRGEEEVTEEEDLELEAIIKELEDEMGMEEEAEEPVTEEEEVEESTVTEAEGEEVDEDINLDEIISALREEEVNLLNAKLLFSNKLFRNHSLNEGQKMKVIENFDRASNLREVKLVFATLSESFNLNPSRTKRSIKESYASKSSASTAPSKKVISEGNDLAARWKKLANL